MEGKRSELQKADSALEVPKDEEPLPASQVPEMAKAEEVRTTMETEPDQETATPSQEAMEHGHLGGATRGGVSFGNKGRQEQRRTEDWGYTKGRQDKGTQVTQTKETKENDEFSHGANRSLLIGVRSQPKVRPICLLNDIGKTFERVLELRINRWQEGSPESDVSEYQFGFRRHRSTCDALRLLREITSAAVNNGGFAVVVSLDICNAFNNIPWGVIRRALKDKLFPPYIRRIIDSYLAEKTVWYTGRDGKSHSWPMEAGVPQGSVLGPVLWNLAFDCVLDIARDDENSNILCYADHTLVVVTGRNCRLTCLKASILVNRVIERIRELGLSVATNKTEAILFRDKRTKGLPSSISIGDTLVKFQPSIKYLGVMIDVSWTFSDHFRYVIDKTERVVRALNKLMPNLRGPDERRRRLYLNVVMSVVLYAERIRRTKLALVPHLEAWVAREPDIGSMAFHLTQVFTGHGCFANFLARIGKRIDVSCDFCGDEDSVYHVLRECPLWNWQRIIMRRQLKLPRDFTLGDVVEAILQSKTNWKVFSAYVEEAMRDKEEEEKRRERAGTSSTSDGDDGTE
ncbi:reverse transcriptase [Lasius niger]|uniref:Reverse transcriptase n=1 Tax=Lasius niger TaxID=67767 RepID=A0A0J7NIB5_LASNI|nr:reverse transcriptase [Lasius niger]